MHPEMLIEGVSEWVGGRKEVRLGNVQADNAEYYDGEAGEYVCYAQS